MGSPSNAYLSASCALLGVGGLLVDFTPLNLVRALQASDICLIAAAALALPMRPAAIPAQTLRLLRSRPRLRWVALAAGLYLSGTGIATGIAGFPDHGVRTWALFALLMLAVAPATAVALSPQTNRSVLLSRVLTAAALLGASAYVLRYALDQIPSGTRGAGFLGSDPLFAMLVGIVIAVVSVIAAQTPTRRFVYIAIALFLVFGLILSSYRSGWIAVIVLVPALMLVATRSVRRVLLVSLVFTVGAYLTYRLGALPHFVTARIDMTFHGARPDLKARQEVLRYLLAAWEHRPWGIGLDKSPTYLPAYYVIGATGAAHNAILSALIEGGPLAATGLLSLPFAVTYAAAPAVRVPHLRTAALWSLGGMWISFVASQGTPSLYPRAAWVCIGAALWVAAIAPSTRARDQEGE